ncbi:unnamed protein product [Clonostachys rosea f. rosea IK726]|uniref:Uncharacterized protein n=1 Tax=Clonostachys rosea f. rosea IK726 TaxID=1349383 RepID=A0ACA9TPR1_BIOOC|nr:unnamed protein product [Clonostachys rosea f. rosea IK726]
MDAFFDGLSNAFSSERLYYIKADEGDENLREFLPRVEDDPTTQALVSTHLLRPKGKADIDETMKGLSASLLGVSICLKPREEAKQNDDQTKETQSPDGKITRPNIIGFVVLGWGGIPASQVVNRRASIGISLSSEYHNKGYGREAFNWMLDWAFRYAGLHTVFLNVFPYNEKAVRLYKSLGFVQEGRLRETRYFNRKWHDELLFAITEDEWEKIRGIENAGGI